MNKSDIHSFDKNLPTFSTEEPKNRKKFILNIVGGKKSKSVLRIFVVKLNHV